MIQKDTATSVSTSHVNGRHEVFSSAVQFARWIGLASALVVLDQASKLGVTYALPLNGKIQVTTVFNLVHALNPGAAFSFLAGAGGWQRHVFTALGLLVSASLIVLLKRGVHRRLDAIAYVGIIGGAMGNVIDRMRIGAVVDFLDFHWRTNHWPAFNLADVFIVSGVGLLMLTSFRTHRRSSMS